MSKKVDYGIMAVLGLTLATLLGIWFYYKFLNTTIPNSPAPKPIFNKEATLKN